MVSGVQGVRVLLDIFIMLKNPPFRVHKVHNEVFTSTCKAESRGKERYYQILLHENDFKLPHTARLEITHHSAMYIFRKSRSSHVTVSTVHRQAYRCKYRIYCIAVQWTGCARLGPVVLAAGTRPTCHAACHTSVQNMMCGVLCTEL